MKYHSKLPWKIVLAPLQIVQEDGADIIANMNPELSAEMGTVRRQDAKAQANAALIVRAVNAHEEMLEAMKQCLAMLQENLEYHRGSCSELLTKAIARAEGRS